MMMMMKYKNASQVWPQSEELHHPLALLKISRLNIRKHVISNQILHIWSVCFLIQLNRHVWFGFSIFFLFTFFIILTFSFYSFFIFAFSWYYIHIDLHCVYMLYNWHSCLDSICSGFGSDASHFEAFSSLKYSNLLMNILSFFQHVFFFNCPHHVSFWGCLQQTSMFSHCDKKGPHELFKAAMTTSSRWSSRLILISGFSGKDSEHHSPGMRTIMDQVFYFKF